MATKRMSRIPNQYQGDAEKLLRKMSQRIQRKRKRKGQTQEQFAEALDISVGTIKTIEQGVRYPSLPMLYYICKKLGIKITIG